jgi:hypothetical protein
MDRNELWRHVGNPWAPSLAATRSISVAISLSVRSASRQSSQRRGTAQVIAAIVIMVVNVTRLVAFLAVPKVTARIG